MPRLKVKAFRLGHWGHALQYPGAKFVLNHEGEFSEEWMTPIGWAPKSAEERRKISLEHSKPKVEPEDDDDYDDDDLEGDDFDDEDEEPEDEEVLAAKKKAARKAKAKAAAKKLGDREPVALSEVPADAVPPSAAPGTGDKEVI